MILPVLGLLVGVAVGMLSPITVPLAYAKLSFLVYIGDRLGIDLYYVALLAFGLRVFQNLAILRRHFFEKHN